MDWSSDVCSSDLQVPVTPTAPVPRIIGPQMVATWVGHSTVLVQTAGLNILTDPIWSERASPVSFIGPKRVREPGIRSEEHTSELQSLMRISYAAFCLKKKKQTSH